LSQAHISLVHRYVEDVVSKGDLDAIDHIKSPDYVNHTRLGSGAVRGTAGVRSVAVAFRTEFRDVKVTIDDVIATGDKVVTRATGYGAHTGEFKGLTPTGKRIEIRIISIFRIADGKIAERWENMDTLTLMKQLGAISE
jgi:steroid delta-isomerase-like uncharacterized protein